MGKTLETVKTINATIRTGLAVAVVGAASVGGYMAYDTYTAKERAFEDLESARQELTSLQASYDVAKEDIRTLNVKVADQAVAIDRLETSMKLLKVDQRLARLDVVSQSVDPETQKTLTKVKFIELTPGGDIISEPKEFAVEGDVIYVDNWVIKFDDSYIETADIERGTSLCLFRRIFGENQSPSDGYSLDEVGMRPQVYARGGEMSEFETKLWSEFWEFANDPVKAAEMGIRAANGEAVSIKVREGMSYSLELRSSGGISITPITGTPSGNPPT